MTKDELNQKLDAAADRAIDARLAAILAALHDTHLASTREAIAPLLDAVQSLRIEVAGLREEQTDLVAQAVRREVPREVGQKLTTRSKN